MKIINLFGGPGIGKSTTAAGIFYHMKNASLKVELVSEYAKDLVWQRSTHVLKDYLYIIAEQHHRLWRMQDHGVQYVITDSPLPIALAYIPKNDPKHDRYCKLIADLWSDFDNDSFLLQRTKKYMEYGRNQNELQAKNVDRKLADILLAYGIKYETVVGDPTAASLIANIYTNQQ